MGVFGILALLSWRALAGTTDWRRPWAWAFALTVLYAATDELHQGFVTGRHPSATDVGIDVAGALIGVWRWGSSGLVGREVGRSAGGRAAQLPDKGAVPHSRDRSVGARASATNSSRIFLIMPGCDLVLGSADHRRNRLQEGCLHSCHGGCVRHNDDMRWSPSSGTLRRNMGSRTT